MEIVTVLLDGPGKNALGTGLMTRTRAALAQAGGAPVLLTGAGGVFSAGLDLKEVASLEPPGMRAFLEGLEALVVDLFHYPGPVVAALPGHAIAGGAVIALCCDHIVATPDPRVRIGLNEVAIGLRFPPATLEVVRHRIPRRHQSTVLLGAGLHSPAEALRLGLVDELAEDAVRTGQARLELLASHPPQAYAASKADLHAGVARIAPPRAAAFMDEVLPLWTSPDLRQRLAAILAPRPRPG